MPSPSAVFSQIQNRDWTWVESVDESHGVPVLWIDHVCL